MAIYVRLDNEINPNQMLQKIQHEINEHRKSNRLENSILCIEIKPVTHVVETLVSEKVSKLLEKPKNGV